MLPPDMVPPSLTIPLLAPPPPAATTLDMWEHRTADSEPVTVHLPHLAHLPEPTAVSWYERAVEVPDIGPDEHVLLRVGGSFYRTSGWIDDELLGSHEGYFSPFGFDLTRFAGSTRKVRLQCATPVEAGAFRQKTAILGVFADWDCKPYPSAAYPHLNGRYDWTVPVGLWQPVQLEITGPVIVQALTLLPEIEDPAWPGPGQTSAMARRGRVRALVQATNLTAEPQTVRLSLEIRPDPLPGEPAEPDPRPVQPGEGNPLVTLKPDDSLIEAVTVSPYDTVELELNAELDRPRLWMPWSHGRPDLYEATLRVRTGGREDLYRRRTGFRQIKADVGEGRWRWELNGRRVFPRGTNYMSDLELDQVTSEALASDIDLVRAANLDLIRVHGHVAHPALYAACDSAGVLVMCDFPLQWTYAYDLPDEAVARFRGEVLRQSEAMVRLLGSSPSIALWSIHNEPPWTPTGAFLGAEVHAAATNREIDMEAAERVMVLDPTRTAISASGLHDDHLYHGWYTGSWEDKRDLRPAFPTEFGAQALPSLESPFWSTVTTEWPVDPEDASWAHAGYQPLFWASPGVGPPSAFRTLADYVEASQTYQAHTIAFAIDRWRLAKFDPVGGYVHFLLADAWPAITWSVLDYFRIPKLGYLSLAEASRPTAVIVDPLPEYEIEDSHVIVYPPDASIGFGLSVVNDDYRAASVGRLSWWVEPMGSSLRRRLRRAWARTARKVVRTAVPPASAGASRVVDARVGPLPRGAYALVAELSIAGKRASRREWRFRVGAQESPRERGARRVPDFLARRAYVKGSFRHTGDGFTFALRNPAMPVVLERLVELSIDAEQVPQDRVAVVIDGRRRRAATLSPRTPVEVASGARLNVVVTGIEVPPGKHRIEITAEFVGLGEVTAGIQDRLG